MTDLIDRGAEFSPCRTWRYRLWRRWAEGPMLMVVGLNPSTADETVDDPTIRRCLDYARQWGFCGLRMLNLFAYRATDPTDMRKAPDPIGRFNDQRIADSADETIAEGGAVLAAWGNHGGYQDRSSAVYASLDYHFIPVACLGLTKAGEPKHPLYLRRDERPVRYVGDGGRLVTGSLVNSR